MQSYVIWTRERKKEASIKKLCYSNFKNHTILTRGAFLFAYTVLIEIRMPKKPKTTFEIYEISSMRNVVNTLLLTHGHIDFAASPEWLSNDHTPPLMSNAAHPRPYWLCCFPWMAFQWPYSSSNVYCCSPTAILTLLLPLNGFQGPYSSSNV